MDQSTHLYVKQAIKRSTFLLVALIFLMGVLLYGLVYSLLHPTSTKHYSKQSLSLPKINKNVPKIDNNTEKNADKWQYITTHSGDSMASVFKRAGLSPKTLQAVIYHNPHAKLLSGIKQNQEIQLLIQNNVLNTLILPLSSIKSLLVQREGDHYVSQINSKKMSTQNQLATATVRGSLYGTAKRMSISYKLIQQMTTIFNWEIDFARDVRSGDQFTILYKAYYIENALVSTGDILAVTYTNRGKIYKAIRHESPEGDADYFTPEGTSLKKAFSRYPLQFSHISSMFSLSRMHPILHYKRPHQGIDLAAPIGTPIHATGDGRIEKIDHHHGYGNMIKITHQNHYTSLYAHLLRFQKGLSQGDKVKRGQVIGYVGQTGLADGPHCHYEFHVNHMPRNPSTVVLPRALSVPRHQLTPFQTAANTLLSQLKLYETANLATAAKRSTDTA